MTSRAAAQGLIFGSMIAVLIAFWILIASPTRPLTLDDAWSLIKTEKPDEAIAVLRRLVAQRPDYPDAALLLAQTALDLKTPQPDLALEQARRFAEPALDSASKPARSAKQRAIWKTIEGKAWTIKKHNAKAEAALLEARSLDPLVAEAGWLLIQLYYQQGRHRENRDLIIRLFEVEPDPADRLALLFEPIRQDALPLAAAGIIPLMKEAVANDPQDWRSQSALGTAQVRDGYVEEGLKTLRQVADTQPNLDSWDAYLAALAESGDFPQFLDQYAKLPAAIASDPRMAAHQARVRQENKDRAGAVAALRIALKQRPDDLKLCYRLIRELQQAGLTEEAQRQEVIHDEQKRGRDEQKAIYQSLAERKELTPSTLRRLAEIRESLGWPQEAAAWRELADRQEKRTSHP